MTEAEWREFIMVGTRTGKLGAVRADGRPLVLPIWFVRGDHGTLMFQTSTSSAKVRAIRHEPRVCLTVDDETPPYSFVMIEALATVITDDDDLCQRIARECGARYMGADRAEEFARRNAVPGECVVVLQPTRVIAEAGVSA